MSYRGRAAMMAMALLAGALSSAHAKDVFTPMSAAPFTPATTPVPGTDGKWHFVYELELANTRPVPATLKRLQVTDVPPADEVGGSARPGQQERRPRILADFAASSFLDRLRQLNNQTVENAAIALNSERLFLIDIALARSEAVPTKLRHLLELTGQVTTDPEALPLRYPAADIQVTQHLPVLRPPLAGLGWVAFNGCCESGVSHRTTYLPVNGKLHYAQRFAIDWLKLDNQGRLRSGPASDVRSYAGYGEELLATADGIVVETLDTLPDQVPPNNPDPSTINTDNVLGNHVILDIGDGFYALYAHMKPGSVRVRVGQKVRAGKVLGLLGNSGNSSAPHLHFHVTDGPSVLASEGVPYVLDRFKLAGKIPDEAVQDTFGGNYRRFLRGRPQHRLRQFPLLMDVVNFRS